MHKKLIILCTLIVLCTPSLTSASWAPLKKVSNELQDEYIRYAWHISKDPAWIMTLERESGFRLDAVGYNTNGTSDHGLCQLNSQYHSPFINSPEFKDYRYQLLYCAKVFAQRKEVFYGYYKRLQVKDRFVWFNN